MGWLVCAYFTKDPIYSKHAAKLIESLKRFQIPYELTPIEPFNDWDKGTHYKARFLQDMLKKYPDHSIVYVDADAIFCCYPDLFDSLNERKDVNIGVHVLDHSKYRRKNLNPEMLSGTIFLRNTGETSIIVQEWITELDRCPTIWDQSALNVVLKNHSFFNLPEEYCTIFDYMSSVKNPVIKHFQASREFKAQQRNRRSKRSRVRVVRNNTVVKLGRSKN